MSSMFDPRRPVPGQSNLRDPVKRTMENSLIRELVLRRRTRGMGFPSGNDQKVSQLFKILYGRR